MKRILISACLAGSIGLLAACGDKGADADGDGKITREEIQAEAGKVKIEPGEWERTMEFVSIDLDESKIPEDAREFTMSAMKGMIGKKQTSTDCVTPEQAEKPGGDFFNVDQKNECDFKEFSMSGGKANISMTCAGGPQGQKADISMAGTYDSDSYEMDAEFASDGGQMGKIAFKAKTSGKRIGECTAETPES